MNQGNPIPFPRAYWPWLGLLLAIHAGIIVWTLTDPFTTPRLDYRPREFLVVTLAGLTGFGVVLARWGSYTRALALSGTLLAAVILLTPSVVVVVGLCGLNAYLTGRRVIRWTLSPGAFDTNPISFSLATLVGLSAWIGVLSLVLSLKIHYAPVYAGVLLVPLLVWWRDSLRAFRHLARLLRPNANKPSWSERGWIALLLTLILLHLFIVAKPDAGSDANTMHLQIPLVVAHAHRWPYDVGRYAWAVMPMGADLAYVATFLLGGETAARLTNFGFGALACRLLYELVRRYARRDIAWASICLVASTPLAFLETGTLFVENLWTAFLLGTLALALDHTNDGTPDNLPAIGLLAAGALQCKAIGIIWIAPVLAFVVYSAWRRQRFRNLNLAGVVVLAVAAVFALWPYATAWVRTGNPVFPFLNSLFRSPYFDALTSFTNLAYKTPLRPWSFHETVVSSGRFIEGADGAAGVHWLLLVPVIALAFLRRRPLAQWLCLALAAAFFVIVFTQQSYLRYLLPAFLLIAVLGGWALNDIPDRRATRVALLVVGGALCLVHIRFMYTASWINATLCPGCAFDAGARANYVGNYLPDRIVSDYLNRNLPEARVGFFMLNAPSPAGYVGYSRSANWHDYPVFGPLARAKSVDDVLAIATRYGLTHAVFRESPVDAENAAIREFRKHHTTPTWRFGDMVVTKIGLAQ
ncbi:MAG: glycosyltransferase family 39 protein [Casimicrobiaceae bacterium]